MAEKSGFLCMYMSNHPDTLVAYVRHWGGVAETVESASMTSIDSKVCDEFELSCRSLSEVMTEAPCLRA